MRRLISVWGLDIYSMVPPSSSGTTVGEALNILSGWNLSAEPRATALFHYLEASGLAYADRNAWVGDPRYVGVPVHSLLDPWFAGTRRCLVHHTALTSPVAPGDPFPPCQRCKNQGTPAPAGNEACIRTTSSPPTSGAASSATPTPSTSSAAAARPCPATGSC